MWTEAAPTWHSETLRDTFLCKAGADERDRRLGTLASIWLKNLYMCSLSSNFHITICKCPWYVTQQFRRTIRNFQVLVLNYTPTPTPTPTEWHGYTCTRGSSSPYTGIRATWFTSLVPCEVVMSWIWNNVMAIQWLLPTFLHDSQSACHPAGCLWCHAVTVDLMYNKHTCQKGELLGLYSTYIGYVLWKWNRMYADRYFL